MVVGLRLVSASRAQGTMGWIAGRLTAKLGGGAGKQLMGGGRLAVGLTSGCNRPAGLVAGRSQEREGSSRGRRWCGMLSPASFDCKLIAGSGRRWRRRGWCRRSAVFRSACRWKEGDDGAVPEIAG